MLKGPFGASFFCKNRVSSVKVENLWQCPFRYKKHEFLGRQCSAKARFQCWQFVIHEKNIGHHLLFTKKCFNAIIKLKLSHKNIQFGGISVPQKQGFDAGFFLHKWHAFGEESIFRRNDASVLRKLPWKKLFNLQVAALFWTCFPYLPGKDPFILHQFAPSFFPVFFLLFLLRNSSAPLHCGNLPDVCEFATSLGFAGLEHYPQLALGFAGPEDYIRGFARFRGSSVFSGLSFAKIECLCRNGKFSPKVLKLEQLKNRVCPVFEAYCRETLGHGKTENHEKK